MDDLCLAAVGRFQLHIVIGMIGEFLIIRHSVVGLLEHVMARRAQRHQILAAIPRRGQRTHGRKLAGDLVRRHGKSAAAALPLVQLPQRNAQLFQRRTGAAIQLLRLVLQRASGIVTKVHRFPFLY